MLCPTLCIALDRQVNFCHFLSPLFCATFSTGFSMLSLVIFFLFYFSDVGICIGSVATAYTFVMCLVH